VINHDHAYVHKIADFEFIDGVFDACRDFIAKGYILIVVTNQSGIGRGYYDEAQFKVLTDWMRARFEQEACLISAVYFSPFHPEKAIHKYLKDSDCRKPKPGMLIQAAKEFNIDITQSVMIGDKESDIQAGQAAGVKTTILVHSDPTYLDENPTRADHVCASIKETVAFIS
jgi:D-glycero-D-manno-heptose 1,7-bisphosphate phosphatase